MNDVSKDAVSKLSAKGLDGEVPLVLIPTRRSMWSLFLEIPSGCACLVQRLGKDVGGVAEPGLMIRPSWYRIAYVVSTQVCTYDAPVASCPTSDDVRVSVDVVIVFQITNAPDFIYNLGAQNFDDFLSGTVDEAIRLLVRAESHTTVYGLRGSQADHMIRLLNQKFGKCGVTFLDVKIASVWLLDSLSDCLQTTTKLQKAMDKSIRRHEYEMLQIRQESQMQVEEIQRRSEQAIVAETGRKRRSELEFEQNCVKAEEDGRISLIDAEMKADIMKMEEEARLNRTQVKLQTERIRDMARTDTKCNTIKLTGELKAEQEKIDAGCKEQEMLHEAASIRFNAETEKAATKSLIAKRKHDLAIREKSILGNIAANGKFNLIGTPGDNIVSALVSGSF